MTRLALFVLISLAFSEFVVAQDRDQRIAELERKLSEAANNVAILQNTIQGLTAELGSLRSPAEVKLAGVKPIEVKPSDVAPQDSASDFERQILRPDLGADEREKKLEAKPELFIQSRYQTFPIQGTTLETARSNFVLTRMESRWAGRLTDKIGMGFEIQYHPAPAGAAQELVNDAFVEYYATNAITVRAGQFVKPFGFDVQQSSSAREAPERGMFAGYLFPGQRDRGVMLAAKLDALGGAWHGAELFAGAFNGNRFFNDNNRQLNYNLRLRKTFDDLHVAAGVSVQFGRQILPEGVSGNNREYVYGADVQWALGRLGVRGEFVAGNMPSTLLGLEPVFAPRFHPGAHVAGGSVFSGIRISHSDQLYARYDQLNRDLVSGQNIRALNFGYFHRLGERSRLGFDDQFKNHLSFNDDLVNTRFQIIWNVLY